MTKIKWGILGLGNIAHTFCEDLINTKDCKLIAVASSSITRASAFAEKFGVPRAYGSYEELYKDPEIEIIYVASLHVDHANHCIEIMNAGKAVLCEKPLGMDRTQVIEMIQASKRNQVFLMEGFWTRFNPTTINSLDQIQNGAIGNVKYINATFNFYALDRPRDSRLFSKDKGGGALLDIGIYPVALAYMILGVPRKVHATSKLNDQNIDVQTAIILEYDDQLAILHCSFACHENMTARICGDNGCLEISSQWHEGGEFVMHFPDGTSDGEVVDRRGNGYKEEIEEVVYNLQSNNKESKTWSLENSLDLVTILDRIRRECNIFYD